MNYYISFWKNAFNFSGRARRAEYWMPVLFNCIIVIVLMLLMSIGGALGTIFSIAYGLFSIANIVPGLSVCFRRIHDIGKAAWFLLLAFIPLVGGIILLVFFCMDSQPGENQYGPNPKEVSSVL